MREILFRGKSVDCVKDGEWVYGYYNVHRGGFDDEYHEYIQEKCGINHMVDPDTVGQFTGLLDKNGNKIFDGDIIRDKYNNVWLVTFERGAFCISNGRISGTLFEPYSVDEVIGNKLDNPELLNP